MACPGNPSSARRSRRARRAATVIALAALVAGAHTSPAAERGAAQAVAPPLPGADEPGAGCRCDDFAPELAAAAALFASRGEGAAFPLTDAMRARYRARVDETYGRARCLAACDDVPDRERDRARALVGFSGFRSNTAGLPKPVVKEG